MKTNSDTAAQTARFNEVVSQFDLIEHGRFTRLHPFREGIAELREKGVSYDLIRELLAQAGLAVAVDTVGNFVRGVIEQRSSPQRRPYQVHTMGAKRLPFTVAPAASEMPGEGASKPNAKLAACVVGSAWFLALIMLVTSPHVLANAPLFGSMGSLERERISSVAGSSPATRARAKRARKLRRCCTTYSPMSRGGAGVALMTRGCIGRRTARWKNSSDARTIWPFCKSVPRARVLIGSRATVTTSRPTSHLPKPSWTPS